MKNFLFIITLILIANMANAQVSKPLNSKFKTENNYKQYLGKAKYLIHSKQSVSVCIDDYFAYKSIGFGYQRKVGKFLADVQLSTGTGSFYKRSANRISKSASPLLGGNGISPFDTARQNLGLMFGAYRFSKFASMSGYLIGFAVNYNNFAVSYDVFSRFGSNVPGVHNTIQTMGFYLPVGMRTAITKHVGIDFIGGLGFVTYNTGTTAVIDDIWDNFKYSKPGAYGNIRLYYAF
jgi:hypothetical protein